MTFHNIRSEEYRSPPVGAVDEYAAWWIDTVLSLDAITK
jgi:hypothetical protein